MAKIFWVEDQSHWIEKFSDILRSQTFDGQATELEIHRSGQAASQHIHLKTVDDKPDVALLDARMNGYDQAGFNVSKVLQKKWPGLPVIYLSELSGTEIEEQAIMENEALDFIAKHQRNIESVLCWRIKAALRRQVSDDIASSDILINGDLKIDLTTWEVFWKGARLMNPHNTKRPLAPTPRKILRLLVERSPRPQNTEHVAEYLGADIDRFSYANYRQHIKTLRTAFDLVEENEGSFLELCSNGRGIATVGGDRAYFWKA